MSNSKKPLDQLSDRELLETQVKLLSRIRTNSANILNLMIAMVVLMIMGAIISAASL